MDNTLQSAKYFRARWSKIVKCGFDGLPDIFIDLKLKTNNDLNGQGTFTWPDGSVYEGHWENGNRTGYGVYTDADG